MATTQDRKLGNCVTLGRQRVAVAGFEAKSCGFDGLDTAFLDEFAEDVLTKYFGAAPVRSVDGSSYEGSTFEADFNDRLSLRMGTWDSILDFGTLEHVFNVPNLLDSIRNSLAVGGIVIHVVPSNNFNGHGFYQFAPELFMEYYSAKNGFRSSCFLATSGLPGKWMKLVREHHRGRISPKTSGAPTSLIVFGIKTNEVESCSAPYQQDYIDSWDSMSAIQTVTHSIPRRKLGMIPGVSRTYLLLRYIMFLLQPVRSHLGQSRWKSWQTVKNEFQF